MELRSTGDVHDAVVRTTGGEGAAKGRVATEAGLALYRRLGWTVDSPITAAQLT